MHALVFAGDRTQQFRRRAGDPTPDDAGQFVIVAPQALRLAVRDFSRGSTVPANEKQYRFPYLAFVGHRGCHHNRNSLTSARVPSACPPMTLRIAPNSRAKTARPVKALSNMLW